MADTKTNETQSNQQRGIATREREGRWLSRRQPYGSLTSPWEFFDRMSEEMDRAFNRLWREIGFPRRRGLSRLFGTSERGFWTPSIETFQKGDQFVVRAELPGMKKEDINVDVTEDAITIRGERREEHEEEREGYYHSERQYGEFYRSIPLPEGVITDSAKATFRDGVLEITMQAPPEEATRGRRLEIT